MVAIVTISKIAVFEKKVINIMLQTSAVIKKTNALFSSFCIFWPIFVTIPRLTILKIGKIAVERIETDGPNLKTSEMYVGIHVVIPSRRNPCIIIAISIGIIPTDISDLIGNFCFLSSVLKEIGVYSRRARCGNRCSVGGIGRRVRLRI